MGMVILTSLGELNDMIMMLHQCTPMANDNDDFIFKELLFTIKYNWVLFSSEHVITEWCSVKHGRAVWNNWICLTANEEYET